ncbi:hypothetical protein QAD02_016935 [Eretmocerus hayati]|uniref:Uncharacterized protein n=1 Tax=Eretmocerus hayati TaxID=131215 RepID=A0ACC2PDI8_9HYME|nr:hypothetical protein QAD02_016935 [Eretmocerus hayati]
MTHVTETGKKPRQAARNHKKGQKQQADEEVEVQLPPPPDGGWGWVVVFASFMIHVITDGVTYSYGLFHEEFKSYFNTTNQAASWVESFLYGVTYCSGPISSFLVNKFGCRAVTVAGTILASGCLMASVFAPNVVVLYITAGAGTGLGFGLIYLPAIVSVTVYFEKYRSLATGIAVCGSGLGNTMFVPLIRYLIDVYGGFKGAMMILAGIVLNCIAFGIMFRPLEPVKSKESVPLKTVTSNGKTSPTSPEDATQKYNENHLSVKHATPRRLSNSKSLDSGDSNNRLALSQPILADKEGSQSREPFTRSTYGSGIMNRSDVFLRSSIHSIRKRSESLTNSEENIRFRLSLRSLPNGTGHRALEPVPSSEDFEDPNIMKRMLRFSLLRDPIFIIFTISNFCTSVGFNVPYVYLVSQATEHGIDEKTASSLLSIVGTANAVGRIVLGYIADKPWVNRLLIYNLCLTICGLSTALSSQCSSYIMFAMYASVFGFTAGAYVGLTSVCLVDLVGLDRLTNAFGLVLLSQGIASFLGPPLAGVLSDELHSYGPGFILAGSMIAISGLMLFFIPPIQRCMQKKSENMQKVATVA